MEIDKSRIEDAIIKQVSDDLISDESMWDRAKSAFDTRIEKLWDETVKDRLIEEINASISKGFEHEYQKVDQFGKTVGEKTTVRNELDNLIKGYWNQTVNKRGEPDSSYGTKLTRAEWVMMQLVADDFKGEMKQHIVNIGGKLKDHLRGSLHETVNELLSSVFYVNSRGDKDIKAAGSHKPGPRTNNTSTS